MGGKKSSLFLISGLVAKIMQIQLQKLGSKVYLTKLLGDFLFEISVLAAPTMH